jgi:hypothetical protein
MGLERERDRSPTAKHKRNIQVSLLFAWVVAATPCARFSAFLPLRFHTILIDVL